MPIKRLGLQRVRYQRAHVVGQRHVLGAGRQLDRASSLPEMVKRAEAGRCAPLAECLDGSGERTLGLVFRFVFRGVTEQVGQSGWRFAT